MIKKLLPLLALAGCTPAVTSQTPETPAAERPCRAEGLADLVGKQSSEALVADAVKRSGAATSRVIGPDTMVTKDYRVDRLNVDIDAAGVVTRVYCG